MPDALPEPARIPNDELERRNTRRLPDGLPPRRLLSWLLLGVDVHALRGGSHEPCMGGSADRLGSDREDRTGRRYRRTRCGSSNGCPRDRIDRLRTSALTGDCPAAYPVPRLRENHWEAVITSPSIASCCAIAAIRFSRVISSPTAPRRRPVRFPCGAWR